jgi:hypothetical protein
MRVVTTCHQQGLESFGHRWLESRKHWPKGTDFQFYPEGFEVDCPGKDLSEIPEFVAWKRRHSGFIAPSWQWDVVKFAHKVFAIIDALYDYDGVGVWMDADCVTYKQIPEGLIEKQVEGAYLACYQRTGMYTETGLWIVDCKHPEHKAFMDFLRGIYLSDRFKDLPQWHDCMAFDATVRAFGNRINVKNLSGEHHKSMHPMAMTELGRYIDHCKGGRKESGRSPENKFRDAA